MTDEQIKEVMRLADVIENLAWSAGKTEQYNDNPVDYAEKLPAARAESAIETPAKVSPCAGHAVQQEADDLVGLRGCNSRHGGMRAVDPCGYRMRTTDPGCTGCVERDEDQPAEAGD